MPEVNSDKFNQNFKELYSAYKDKNKTFFILCWIVYIVVIGFFIFCSIRLFQLAIEDSTEEARIAHAFVGQDNMKYVAIYNGWAIAFIVFTVVWIALGLFIRWRVKRKAMQMLGFQAREGINLL